jgi:hypothetical protein
MPPPPPPLFHQVLPVDAAPYTEEVGPDDLHGLQQASLVHVGLHLDRRRLFVNRSIEAESEFSFFVRQRIM